MQSDKTAKKPKIVTVTANTAIDFFIGVNNFSTGANLIADHHVEYAAGKGINIAKSVASLMCQVSVLGFVGEQSFDKFDAIKSALISTSYIAISGKTRTNITLTDTQLHTETHIRTTGYSVTSEDCQKLIKQIDDIVEQDDIVVLSGSLPAGAACDLYRDIIELCHKNSAIAFLDSSGECLREGVKAKPYLVKPNLQELEELLGKRLLNDDEIITAAKTIIDQGVKLVAVSRGEEGVMLVDQNDCFTAFADFNMAMPVSTIGCGDAMLAGFAVAKIRGLGITDLIKLGVSCATANLFSFEPGNVDKDQVTSIIPDIFISRKKII